MWQNFRRLNRDKKERNDHWFKGSESNTCCLSVLIFNYCLLVCEALHGLTPDRITQMVLICEKGRPLKSSVPQSRTKTFGDAAFSPLLSELLEQPAGGSERC